MRFRLLNFDKIEKNLMNEATGQLMYGPDYFQWYTAGIESVVKDNENQFFIIDRFDNERPEVITWKYYNDSGISDIVVLANNDNYLWDAPMDWDSLQDVIKNRMNYIKKINKTTMTEEEEKYWETKIIEEVTKTRDIQSSVVLPRMGDLQSVIRKMKKYITSREVK
jgi:hypothetical protein